MYRARHSAGARIMGCSALASPLEFRDLVRVDLKKEIGINLSAQSGYNQNVAIKLTMGTGGGYFCGSNDLPPQAQWVVMDQTPFGNPGPAASRSR